LRGGENVVLGGKSEVFFGFFLLAQEGEPLLFRIHGDNHKQTKYHKNESNHAHRIARSPKSVLYNGFANTKQICKSRFVESSACNSFTSCKRAFFKGIDCHKLN